MANVAKKTQEEGKMSRMQLCGLVAAILILVGMNFVPVSESFPVAARNTLGILIAVIIMLVTEVMPIGIVCLAAIPMLYFFHCVDTVPGALTGFTNATLFFVLASFGISEALTVVPVSKRLLLLLMRRWGRNTRQLLFAIMFVTALLSSVISNVAAAAVFIPIVQEFLMVYDNEEERKRTGKAYMIALPVASMIGGMMTPAGSSINMMAIGMLEKNTGITIPFVKWMIIGIPLVIVMLPIAYFFCVRTFKPADLEESKIQGYIAKEMKSLPAKITLKEKYVIFVLGVMLVLWILSSWIPQLQIAAVALVGLALFFLPGKARILTWNDYKRCVSLEAFILMGVMISFGGVITASGLSSWIAAVIFPSSFPQVGILGIAFICALTFLLLIPIPVAPALVGMLSATLIEFCAIAGLSSTVAMMAFALCVANCYLVPLDTVPLMTYVTGYYKMFDMPKVTIKIQLSMIVMCSVWLTVIGKVFGL